jgi:hypothetical protein
MEWEDEGMPDAVRTRATVLPGNRIEITDPALREGETVDVIVVLGEPSHGRVSAIDLLESLPGQRLFKTPEEADRYLNEERDSWER